MFVCLLRMILIENSYEHHSLDEPAILLGGSFMVDVVESAQVAAEQKE